MLCHSLIRVKIPSCACLPGLASLTAFMNVLAMGTHSILQVEELPVEDLYVPTHAEVSLQSVPALDVILYNLE